MSTPAEHFERLYRADADPWRYRTSRYEAAKYAATLGALTRDRYASGLEAGCSIGVLSAQLAPRCDRLLAVDFIAKAVDLAAMRLTPHPGAQALRATLPDEWPKGRYDLIVLSELLYYLSPAGIDALARHVARDAVAGAECVIVHFQGETGTDLRPDAARERFCDALGGLRPLWIADHPSPADYNHRTLLLAARSAAPATLPAPWGRG